MNERSQYKNRIELLQGTLDMLILQTLQWGPQHGYGIVQALRLRSGDVLQVETGSLYPALHRLERQSWVQSEWKQSESKQKARYYRITAKGKKQLASDLGRWERIVEAIGSVMYVKPEESESCSGSRASVFSGASANCRKRLMRTCRWRLQIEWREARRQRRRDKRRRGNLEMFPWCRM
jgi:transcriptional regulator